MKVTSKGQVTIPQPIREKLGLGPQSEVEFVEESGKVYLVKKDAPIKSRFSRWRGAATVKMTTPPRPHRTTRGVLCP